MGAGAKEAETGEAVAARRAPRRGAAWSCRRGSGRYGRCSFAPAAAGTRCPLVSVAPRAGESDRGAEGEAAERRATAPRPRAATGMGAGVCYSTPSDGRRLSPASASRWGTRGGGAFRIPGGDGGAGGRRLAAALPSLRRQEPKSLKEPGAWAPDRNTLASRGGSSGPGMSPGSPERVEGPGVRERSPRSGRARSGEGVGVNGTSEGPSLLEKGCADHVLLWNLRNPLGNPGQHPGGCFFIFFNNLYVLE